MEKELKINRLEEIQDSNIGKKIFVKNLGKASLSEINRNENGSIKNIRVLTEDYIFGLHHTYNWSIYKSKIEEGVLIPLFYGAGETIIGGLNTINAEYHEEYKRRLKILRGEAN